jgi:ribonuclease HII
MRAIESLSLIPQHVLVDGRRNPSLKIPQTAIVGGDRKSFCIAAASIIAKVERDRMMRDLDSLYPGYGFAAHKGYCTASHIAAVGRLGPSPVHRTSFFRVREALQIKLLL